MLPCGCIVCNDDLHKHIHRITWLKYVKENISTTGTLTISLQGQAFGFTHMNVKNEFGLECSLQLAMWDLWGLGAESWFAGMLQGLKIWGGKQ